MCMEDPYSYLISGWEHSADLPQYIASYGALTLKFVKSPLYPREGSLVPKPIFRFYLWWRKTLPQIKTEKSGLGTRLEGGGGA